MDISHLAPCIVEYNVPADSKNNRPSRCYRVQVKYSDHCYTTKKEGSNTERIFNQQRYDLSKKLPFIIQNLLTLQCSFANGVNYYTINITEDNQEYEVYFELYKAKGTGSLHLIVHSAYVCDVERQKNRPKWESVRFSVILYSTLMGKKLHRKK